MIEVKEGEALNINKKVTKKLFDNWKRNLVKINKSNKFEGSERIIIELQKPTKAVKKMKDIDQKEESSVSFF